MSGAVARRIDDRPLWVMPLSPEVVELLQRPIRGKGGFQTLFRRIQAGLDGSILVVAEEDLDRLVQMSSGGRGRKLGGYQVRAEAVIVAAVCWRNWGRGRSRLLHFNRSPKQRRLVFRGADDEL